MVFCKHLDLGPEKAVAYLGRYLNRVAVHDRRVRRLPGGDVLVSYRDKEQRKHVRLCPDEFLRRYLQHVLPRGFNKVRRYGLLAPGNAPRLKALRCQLLLTTRIRLTTLAALAVVHQRIERQRKRPCPVCETGIMQRVVSPCLSDAPGLHQGQEAGRIKDFAEIMITNTIRVPENGSRPIGDQKLGLKETHSNVHDANISLDPHPQSR